MSYMNEELINELMEWMSELDVKVKIDNKLFDIDIVTTDSRQIIIIPEVNNELNS